ncbi:MAG: Crp/Fnr family transcriptional regulator [Saprospiraceae bacterium]|nr:Crp/Fnr family transcriptional regulator [Saprospiraceae bacterium]
MDKQAKINFLKSLPMFGSLNEVELAQLADAAQYKMAPRYHFVYMPDEAAEHLYLLVKGRVKTGTFSGEGREIIKELVGPQMMFGDLTLAGETKRSEFAQSLHDGAEFLVVRLTDFYQLMQDNQRLVFACMTHISQRLQRVEERLANLVVKDARERIIEFLQNTATREGRRVGFETLVKHHLTQQEIASLTGTSRQTVTSVFNELKRSNLIYFNRNSILIRDVEKLA